MANEEHLEILQKGVEEWNRWREQNPEVAPDLREAELAGAHLVRALLDGAHLHDASLVGASLEGTHLNGARLDRARLDGAYLYDARLVGARLDGASLYDTSLVGAHLNGASLRGACLDEARLYNASLRDAYLQFTRLDHASLDGALLEYTVFADIDLRQVKDLESVKHHGPSHVSTSTLDRSRGQIPSAFLKGCGLSDWQIENAKLFNPDLDEDERTTIWYEIECIRGQQPWAISRVFISYTRRTHTEDDEAYNTGNENDEGPSDEPFVEALEKRFDDKGVRYWRDVHDLKAGRLERQIDRAITLYPLVLLVLSERSVLSDWVEWEVAKARELEREYEKAGEPRDVLCPVALDEAWKSCTWPGPLRRQIEDYNVLDFSGWEDDKEKMTRQFTRLYEGLVLNYGRKGKE